MLFTSFTSLFIRSFRSFNLFAPLSRISEFLSLFGDRRGAALVDCDAHYIKCLLMGGSHLKSDGNCVYSSTAPLHSRGGITITSAMPPSPIQRLIEQNWQISLENEPQRLKIGGRMLSQTRSRQSRSLIQGLAH